MLYILAGISGIIFFIHFVLAAGVLLNRMRDTFVKAGDPGDERVSVIVAAKDEEKTLPELLISLEHMSYSDFDIILVDDRSSDGTARIMNEFKQKHTGRVTVIHNNQNTDKINGKQFALDKAVKKARGNILIFTDADCIVPEYWIESLMKYFKDPEVGIVFGQLSLPDEGSFLKRYQAFDQPLIHQYNSGSAAYGFPTGCFGNNLAARKAVLDDVGGFKSLGYTVTEDADLIEAAGKKKWKIRVSTLRSTMIRTYAQNSWKGFINQHTRWNSGAYYSEDFSTRLSYRFIVLYLLISILVIPFSAFMPILLILPVTSFISIGLLALLSGLLYRENKTAFLLRIIPYTLFFMLFYAFITSLSIFKFSLEWKGNKLQRP